MAGLVFFLCFVVGGGAAGASRSLREEAQNSDASPIGTHYDVVVIPGASIYRNEDSKTKGKLPYLLSFSSESRTSAGAVVLKDSPALVEPPALVFTGGYNIGVRYLENGTVINSVNSVKAYAKARDYASEAYSMKQFINVVFGFSTDCCMVEEDSESTVENAYFTNGLILRLSALAFQRNNIAVGLLTNLYHMPEALPLFGNDTLVPGLSFTPLFAEDFICLLKDDYHGADWIKTTVDYYKDNFGSLWDYAELDKIMTARRGGDYSKSVGSLWKRTTTTDDEPHHPSFAKKRVD